MPFYDFVCEGGHVTEARREVDRRDDPLSCPLCARKTIRGVADFAISGQHDGVSFYEFERNAWNLATGKDHKTPREMERDLKAQGKEIVPPGWKPPRPKEFDEIACEKALTKIYKENHDVGSV